mmetsp:Transcript_7338/g.13903  ORF Transcript_7338/g.13903 Transcript_7338/m.13903 type:complete len:302 (-) Transcript_7338:320-1225(-)
MMGASRWHGMMRVNFHLHTRSTHSNTSSAQLLYTRVTTTGATSSRLVMRCHDSSGSSKLLGPKYSAWSVFRCQPRRSLSSRVMSAELVVRDLALSLMLNRLSSLRELMTKLLSSPDSSSSFSAHTSEGVSETCTTQSVTSSVRVGLWNTAASLNLTKLDTPTGRGDRICTSNSSAKGSAAPAAASSRGFALKMPKKVEGRLSGQDHWPGTTKLCARGKRREKGPMKSLCSNSVVGRTMYSTGASSSLSSARHSAVGATGAYTNKPPLAILITVMRTFTATLSPSPMPCFCSNRQILPGSTS